MKVANSSIGVIVLIISSCNQTSTNETNNKLDQDRQTRSNYQFIVLDDQHNHAATKEGEEKAFYEIDADKGLIIDATNYKFEIPQELNENKIQAIQVVIDGNVYESNWQASGKVILDSNSLRQILGKEKFNGFKSGKTVAIGIGIKQQPERSGSVSLGIIYAAMVKVR